MGQEENQSLIQADCSLSQEEVFVACGMRH